MGTYIKKHLGANEHIIYKTDISAIIYVPYVIGALVGICTFLVITPHDSLFSPNGLIALCGSLCLALIFMFVPWLERICSEFAVTNKRVIMKTGLIRRNVFEMRLAKVESIDLAQGIMGRLFGYGNVTVQGTGEGSKTFSMIPNPAKFRQEIMDAADLNAQTQ